MAFLRDFQSQARRHGAPVTVAVIVIAAVNFLINWLSGGRDAWNALLTFTPGTALSLPWTLLTWPISAEAPDFIGTVFMCYWMWVIGGMVERELSSLRYSVFLLVMALIPALMMLLALPILGDSRALWGLYLLAAAVTIAWATRNPNQTMLFMMVVPIAAKWLAWLTVGIVIFGYGFPKPVLGLLAAVHLLVAYLYAANKIPFLQWGRAAFVQNRQGWKPQERDNRYFDEVRKREQERAERERLRKLFEGSLGEDPEDKR